MIHFGNPAALWLLTLIFPLVLLYLLKHKRHDWKVPSLLLWKLSIEDLRAQTPFQKLRSNLLLLLQILIIVLLTALLSQPYVSHLSRQSSRWILVQDISAGMKATDETPDRFRVARDRLLRILDAAGPIDEIMLISLSSEASILQSFSRNHAAIRSLLLSMHPEDVGEDWHPLEKILQPILKQKPLPRLVIASDFANFPARLKQQFPFEAVCVGKSSENISFTKAVLQPLPEDLQNQVLFFELTNFGKETRVTELQIRRNNDLIDAYEISLGGLQVAHRSVRVEIPQPAEFTLLLKPDDFLVLDNDFTLKARPQEKTKVQVEIDNPFLIRALKVLPLVEISTTASVFIGRETPLVPEAGIFFQDGSRKTTEQIVQWNSAHPVLRFVDAGLWRFSKFTVLNVPEGADILMETREGPVGYAGEQSGKRQVVLGFALEDSNMPTMAGFPVFLQNAIEWIMEPTHTLESVTTGPEQKLEGAFQQGNIQGFANFLNSEESNIEPQQIQGATGSEAQMITIRQDLSSWFLLCLIGVIILEWWAFHQKYEV